MKLPIRILLASGMLATGVITASAQSNSITVQVNTPGVAVSPNLFGIFFEEINFGGDGGLYAEMVRNRSFAASTTPVFWTLVTNGVATGAMAIDYTQPLTSNAPASLRLTKQSGAGSIGAANSGYFGMSVINGASYNFSMYAAGSNGFAGPISIQLQSANGVTNYAQTSISGLGSSLQKFTAVLSSTGTDTNARLVLSITNTAAVWVDEVSLFPQATFNNRANGMRQDIANLLVALTPSFMRYPGGNFIESNTVTNAVRWKKTIGDTSQRPGHQNDAWGYWSTDGFGLPEFLQFCDDLGMEPLYGINCGLMLGYNGATNNTVPTNQMGPWVQDAIDLISYCNDPTNTTWGAQRAANGHPAPFNMKYLEIGNENGGPLYDQRYTMFYDAMKSNYPNIKLISPVWGSPSSPVSRPVEIRDEHYYTSPATFMSYATKYDTYDRNGPKVFVGEYAVTSGYGTNGNLSAALGEAAFMTGMERNSDIVQLASYAPLFKNVGGVQWSPDLINYDNSRVFGTPAYYVQRLFSNHRGDKVLPTAVTMVTPNTLFVSSTFIQASNLVLIKAVNPSANPLSTTISLNGVSSVASNASVFQLSSANNTDENTLSSPTNVFPVTNNINNAGTSFTVNLPAYSLSIYSLSASGIQAITNLQFQITSPINVGQQMQSSLFGQQIGSTNLINLAGNYAASYSSLNTNIAIVSGSGLVTGVSTGTVSIVAMYNSLSVTNSVQVVPAGPTTLIHRYSFNDGTANDSIGTANGTFFNASGLSSISGGQLNLVGSNGDYVNLGSGVVNTTNISNGAVTFEAWATFNSANGSWTRLFDFGNISGSSGGNYIFLTPNNAANGGSARVAVSDATPGGSGSEAGITFGYNLLGQSNIHLVVVFNPSPQRQFLGLYTNGILSASTSTGNKTIASINDAFSFLGHSLWSGDAYLRGSIDEFRIYNGELDKYQIAASLQGGPNQTNWNVGTLVSFALNPGPMPVALYSQHQITANLNFTLASNVNVIGDTNLTLSSDNTNVFTINQSGVLSALAVGTANLTGVYTYVSVNNTNVFTNSVAVTVYRDLPGILMHRYSFTGDANDSVGTADGTLQGSASISNNQLALPNATSAAPANDYLLLPAGIVTNDPAVTIEAWATISSSQYTWANLFDFGTQNGSGQAAYDIHVCVHSSSGSTITGISDSDNANAHYQPLDLGPGTSLDGNTNIHIVTVYNPPAGYESLYLNGVLAGFSNITISMSGVRDVRNLIGADNWPDAGLKGSVDEFRIYNGVLHADEIAATQALGANTLLSASQPVISYSVAGGNITLTWPVASAGFTLQSRTNAGSGAWSSVFPLPQIVGNQWQVTVPMTGTAQYFQLRR